MRTSASGTPERHSSDDPLRPNARLQRRQRAGLRERRTLRAALFAVRTRYGGARHAACACAIHARKLGPDVLRDLNLCRLGFQIIRIEAELVLRDLPAAVALVRTAL